jgi:glycosyltransferase involved in cell wall biosynthesis
VGAIKNGKIINFLEKIELKLYKDTTEIIAVTNSFKENLISRGIDKNKIDIIPNGSNLELFYPREKNQELLNKLNLQGKFIVGYIGTHGMAHGLDFILNSLRDIKDNSIHFLFIGDGAVKQNLKKMAKKLNLKNVTFLKPIRKEDVPNYLSIIDVSLVPLKKNDLFKTVIPSKIFESCAMHKPILLGVEGESKGIIEEYNAGVCFEPENKIDFIRKLKILRDKNKYKIFQKGCSLLAKNFDRKELANKFFFILKECIISPS